MSTTQVGSNDATGDASVENLDMTLDVVTIPVSALDRAKEFAAYTAAEQPGEELPL